MSYYDEVRGQGEVASDGWRERSEQWLRFEAVARALEVEPRDSVLDLGCGTGALREYLGRDRPGAYLGVDLHRREQWGRGPFVEADAMSSGGFSRPDGEGFDVAVAIGTLVGGQAHPVKAWLARLAALSTQGWALVVLNQDRLDGDPIRSLDPALRGARRSEVEVAAAALGSSVVIVDSVISSDLFIFGGPRTQEALQRLDQEACFEAVFERAESGPVERAWLYCATERWEQAIGELRGVHEEDRGRRWWLLRERLLNAGRADPAA